MFKKLWEISRFMSYNGMWEIFLEEKTKKILTGKMMSHCLRI